MAQIERGDAKAQYFRLAVVANHAAGNQRLHHRIALRVAIADMAAAAGMLTRGDQRQWMMAAALFHQLDEQVGQCQRFFAQCRHAGLQGGVQPALHQRHRQDGLGAAQKARMPWAGW
jgi:hypothetical protein